MEPQTLQALIPAIPGMITAGLEVWKAVIKPLLGKIGYSFTKEQELEMLALEEKKDIKTFIEKLEEISKEINLTINLHSQAGDNNLQVNKNEGTIYNSPNIYIGTEPSKSEVKKN
jgi:hypothetical protein